MNWKTIQNLLGKAGTALCFCVANTVAAQDLCETGAIAFAKTQEQLTVTFDGYFPFKLVAASDCDIDANCVYDLIIVSGDDEKIHREGLEIPRICGVAMIEQGQFERHTVSDYAPMLRRAFPYSREKTIIIPTVGGTIQLTRLDFAPAAGSVGWLSPLVEGGGTMSEASPAASSYHVALTTD